MATVQETYDSMTTPEFGTNDVFNFYEDSQGHRRRTRKVSANGTTVGASSEAYVNSSYCVKNAIRNGMQRDQKYTVNE